MSATASGQLQFGKRFQEGSGLAIEHCAGSA
jgi:hypothetical protein